MRNLIILILGFLLLSVGKSEENLELRIFNNSKFRIEKLKISFAGQESTFKNIAPKSYSEVKKVKGLWKDNCYDLTVFKKKLLAENFWSHQICIPVDHIGNNVIEKGKYTIILKIRQINAKQFEVESEYIKEKKNEW
ncbi:hypothetical protein ACFPVY_14015 [Flavobacterium qiangtangense]|uniref:DUF4625 domain-containing protein n=1 Tax=Flavobacterium qiangtangense TaxID=1442595 RepID=A0ABW1PQ30_9FLAO